MRGDRYVIGGEGYMAVMLMRNCFPSICIARVMAKYLFLLPLIQFLLKRKMVVFGYLPVITAYLNTSRKLLEFRGIQLQETSPKCGNERRDSSN